MLDHISQFLSCPSNEPASYDVSELVGYDCSIELSPWSHGVSWRNVYLDSNWRADIYDDPNINFSFLIYANKNKVWEKKISNKLVRAVELYQNLTPDLQLKLTLQLSLSAPCYRTNKLIRWVKSIFKKLREFDHYSMHINNKLSWTDSDRQERLGMLDESQAS